MKDPPKANHKNTLSLVALALLYLLIILYTIFSQSLPSTLALLFLIISLILNIAAPASLSLKNLNDKPYDWTRVIPHQIDKVLWGVYVFVSTAFFIVKLGLYYSGITDDWDTSLQDMLEVQSALWLYLPIILIPLALAAMLRTPKSHLLKDYSPKVNPFASLPLYLTLTILIILIQVFSISISGLIYFFLALYIYWMKKFNFRDFQFKILLISVQILTTIVIVLSYFVTIEFVQTESTVENF